MNSSIAHSRVVIQDCKSEPVLGVAIQLLDVLGHDVAMADSAESALQAAMQKPTDLLVLNLTDLAEQSAALERLALLPAAARPRQVAILSDADEESTGVPLQRKLLGVKVHVFTKSIHAHGLLKVIKRIAMISN